jgi:hypothetical protein
MEQILLVSNGSNKHFTHKKVKVWLSVKCWWRYQLVMDCHSNRSTMFFSKMWNFIKNKNNVIIQQGFFTGMVSCSQKVNN